MWLPLAHIASIEMEAPKRLRDLLWAPALVRTGPAFKGQELGEVLMPALSPFSFRHADDAVRLGRATVWEEPEDGDAVPFGTEDAAGGRRGFPDPGMRSLEIAAAKAIPNNMPLRNDLLNPISGDNPAGENLRYAPVYDKIKEARREDDDAAAGRLGARAQSRRLAAHHQADHRDARHQEQRPATGRVAGRGHAPPRRRRRPARSARPQRGLLENFWDSSIPGARGRRRGVPRRAAAMGRRPLEMAVKHVAAHAQRAELVQYKESRAVGTEEAADTEDKAAGARSRPSPKARLTQEEFDKDFDATPKTFYVDLEATFDGTLESLARARPSCATRNSATSRPLSAACEHALEEVGRPSTSCCRRSARRNRTSRWRRPRPKPSREAEAAKRERSGPAAAAARRAGPRAGARRRAQSAEPADRDDAIARVVVAAQIPAPARIPTVPPPYLLLRGLRWGELRAAGDAVDPALLAAPPTEIRQKLKRLALEGQLDRVLEAAETAMGMDCGRGWLDLQRYAWPRLLRAGQLLRAYSRRPSSPDCARCWPTTRSSPK